MFTYKGEVFSKIPDGAVGFIYLITRLNIEEDKSSPIYYIGKKLFLKKTKSANKDSDWKTYYGSSKWLKEDIEKYGTENFSREITHIAYSKSELTYLEVMEQIKKNVLKVDKFSFMQKKYYNLNILGKFFKNKYFTKQDKERIKEYINTGSEEYERIGVTNGKESKFINQLVYDIDEWLVNNPSWKLGTHYTSPLKDCVCVTNGITNEYINEEDLNEFLKLNNEWYKGSYKRGMFKAVNDGKNTRRIPKDDVNEFLKDNPEWRRGAFKPEQTKYINIYSKSKNLDLRINEKDFIYYKDNWEIISGVRPNRYIWINKDGQDKKIERKDYDLYSEWDLGRYESSNKNRIAITNGSETKYISKSNEIVEGWYLGNSIDFSKINRIERRAMFNPITNKLLYVPKEDIDKFKKEGWEEGRNYSSSENRVYAKDIRNGEKITVSVEEYKNNEYLTSLKTKKVKIKIKNRIVFKGYLKYYILTENPYNVPEKLFGEALRSETGIISKKHGKYKHLTELKIQIRYI